jgi:hypothetical protein
VVAIGLAVVMVVGACGDDASGDVTAFCDNRDRFETLGDFLVAPPEQAEGLVATAREIFADGIDVAPDDIRGSYETLVDGFLPLLDVFEASGFGVATPDADDLTAALEGLGAPEVEAANEAVESWYADNCPAG